MAEGATSPVVGNLRILIVNRTRASPHLDVAVDGGSRFVGQIPDGLPRSSLGFAVDVGVGHHRVSVVEGGRGEVATGVIEICDTNALAIVRLSAHGPWWRKKVESWSLDVIR
jgi:hypothetical protein